MMGFDTLRGCFYLFFFRGLFNGRSWSSSVMYVWRGLLLLEGFELGEGIGGIYPDRIGENPVCEE
jgi:hypothetical protein